MSVTHSQRVSDLSPETEAVSKTNQKGQPMGYIDTTILFAGSRDHMSEAQESSSVTRDTQLVLGGRKCTWEVTLEVRGQLRGPW